MEIVISDASTLILLTKAKLIDLTLKYFDIVVPTIVYEEIERGKSQNIEDAFEIEELVNSRKIKIKNPKDKYLIDMLTKKFSLDVGALHAIALAKEENRSIFVDDKKGLCVCKLLNINTYTAIRLLNTFYLTKLLTKEELKEKLEILRIKGRYTIDEEFLTRWLIVEKKKNISLRLSKETVDRVNLLSKLETLDKSIILRRAIELGLKEISTEVAIKGFGEDKLSYSEGAKLSDMYVGEFMELLSQRGVQIKPYSYEIKQHLDKSEKHLLKILSDQIKKNKIKYNVKKKEK